MICILAVTQFAMFPDRIPNQKVIIFLTTLLVVVPLATVSGAASSDPSASSVGDPLDQGSNTSIEERADTRIDRIPTDVGNISNKTGVAIDTERGEVINISNVGFDESMNAADVRVNRTTSAVDVITDNATGGNDTGENVDPGIDGITNDTHTPIERVLDGLLGTVGRTTGEIDRTIETGIDGITDDGHADLGDRTVNGTTGAIGEITRPIPETPGNGTDVINDSSELITNPSNESDHETTGITDQTVETTETPKPTRTDSPETPPGPVSNRSTPKNDSDTTPTTHTATTPRVTPTKTIPTARRTSTPTATTGTQQRKSVPSPTPSVTSTPVHRVSGTPTETATRATPKNTSDTPATVTTTPTTAIPTTTTAATHTSVTVEERSSPSDGLVYQSNVSDDDSGELHERENTRYEQGEELNASLVSSSEDTDHPMMPTPETGAALGATAIAAGALTKHGDVLVGAVSNSPSTVSARMFVISRSGLYDRFADPFSRLFALFRYSRYDGSDPLEHDGRKSVFEAIEDTPGVYLSAISERTGLSLSTIRHHLSVLEQESLVMSAKVHGKRRFYPAYSEQVELTAAMNDEATANVIDALSRLGPVSVSDLADDLDRDPSTVTHHLQRLADDDIVVRERDGRTVMNRLSSNVYAVLADRIAANERDGNALPSSAD